MHRPSRVAQYNEYSGVDACAHTCLPVCTQVAVGVYGCLYLCVDVGVCEAAFLAVCEAAFLTAKDH
jgi:hypothetical protein